MRRIYDKLEEEGLNPCFPGQHNGLCREPYVVILHGGIIPSLSSRMVGQELIELLIYYPVQDGFVGFDNHVSIVKGGVSSLSFLRKTSNEGQVVVDNDKEAYTKSVEYVMQKKLEV